MKRPQVIAHRGNSRNFPENTGPAFENIGVTVDGLETDIQLSRDGVPVLYHDRTLRKLTGRMDKVCSQTLESLRRLDFGEWFSPDFKGTRILSLNEFLANFGRGKKLFLEIKARKEDQDRVIKELTEKVVSEVTKEGIGERVHILSFNPDVLIQAHSASDSVGYMQIFEKHLPHAETLLRAAPWLRGYVVALSLLSKAFVDAAHSASKTVAAFTCNTDKELSRSINLNVDGVISDNPDAACEWLNKQF